MVLSNVSGDTFGRYLDVASSHGLQRLEAKCIDFLLANFEKVGACNSPSAAYSIEHRHRPCRIWAAGAAVEQQGKVGLPLHP